MGWGRTRYQEMLEAIQGICLANRLKSHRSYLSIEELCAVAPKSVRHRHAVFLAHVAVHVCTWMPLGQLRWGRPRWVWLAVLGAWHVEPVPASRSARAAPRSGNAARRRKDGGAYGLGRRRPGLAFGGRFCPCGPGHRREQTEHVRPRPPLPVHAAWSCVLLQRQGVPGHTYTSRIHSGGPNVRLHRVHAAAAAWVLLPRRCFGGQVDLRRAHAEHTQSIRRAHTHTK